MKPFNLTPKLSKWSAHEQFYKSAYLRSSHLLLCSLTLATNLLSNCLYILSKYYHLVTDKRWLSRSRNISLGFSSDWSARQYQKKLWWHVVLFQCLQLVNKQKWRTVSYATNNLDRVNNCELRLIKRTANTGRPRTALFVHLLEIQSKYLFPPHLAVFLAPTGAQAVLLSVCPSGTSLSLCRAVNLHLLR